MWQEAFLGSFPALASRPETCYDHAMETTLVTGGAGFIGSNFVRQWIAEQGT
jgi:FlaA1/EpsC-like NDP-sugar epimerase